MSSAAQYFDENIGPQMRMALCVLKNHQPDEMIYWFGANEHRRRRLVTGADNSLRLSPTRDADDLQEPLVVLLGAAENKRK